MIRMFNIYVPTGILLVGVGDVAVLSTVLALVLYLEGAAVSGQAAASAGMIVCCLFIMGAYNRANLWPSQISVLRMLVGFGLAVPAVAVLLMLGVSVTPQVLALSLTAGLIALFLFRGVLSRFIGLPLWKTRIAVLGTGEEACRIEALERAKAAQFVCMAFFPTGDGQWQVGSDRLVNTNNLVSTCQRLGIDELVLAEDGPQATDSREMLLQARMKGLSVIDSTTLFERELGQVDIAQVYPDWLLFTQGALSRRIAQVSKRVFDVLISLLLLTLALPMMVLTALVIWLEDRGPILYRQERVGLNGATFEVLKFRSMRVDAEKDGVARWAALNDPRVTMVGNIIRKIRVDELPQLINVLRGEMSFVGPRPERPSIVTDLAREIPSYTYRHVIKPGITGWAQINYPYGASIEDSKQKLKYDLYYVKNQNLFLDLIIILQTVRVVLWPQGVR